MLFSAARVLSGFAFLSILLGILQYSSTFNLITGLYSAVLLVALFIASLAPKSVYESRFSIHIFYLYAVGIVLSFVKIVEDFVVEWGPDYGAMIVRMVIVILLVILARQTLRKNA